MGQVVKYLLSGYTHHEKCKNTCREVIVTKYFIRKRFTSPLMGEGRVRVIKYPGRR
jgi:hypothetical protein